MVNTLNWRWFWQIVKAWTSGQIKSGYHVYVCLKASHNIMSDRLTAEGVRFKESRPMTNGNPAPRVKVTAIKRYGLRLASVLLGQILQSSLVKSVCALLAANAASSCRERRAFLQK